MAKVFEDLANLFMELIKAFVGLFAFEFDKIKF